MIYDVAIIGAGAAGIFSAYELYNLNPELKIILIEQGSEINNRFCPLLINKSKECLKCNPCHIMTGFGGCGAFSDGKFNFTSEFGGWLNEYILDSTVLDLIHYVDEINSKFLINHDSYFSTSNSSIEKLALENDLHLLHAQVRHIGTDNNIKILKNMQFHLSDKIETLFNTKVESISKKDNKFSIDTLTGKTTDAIHQSIQSKYLIVAPGRAGSEWFSNQCKKLKLKQINNRVDIGIRLELPAKTWEHITKEVYEAKLLYRTKQYGDIVRTFCMNPNGHVVIENTDGIITVNGHSYNDKSRNSQNTNFALLVSNKFTEPFKEPHQYGKRIASFSNMLGGGIIVQRFGDLIKGRRTTETRLKESFVKPTLNAATAGDLSLVLPKRHLDNIIEMIYQLDKIALGTANHDTLLYGVEVKFYSGRLELSCELETKIENMFAIGDGAGITRSLSQAAASGIYVAERISERISK